MPILVFIFVRVLQAIQKTLPNYLIWGIIPGVLIFGLSLWILSRLGIDAGEALRDPAQQSGASSLVGFLSHIGIWCWVASGAISFFLFSTSGKKAEREMYLLMAVLSLALAADDLFMIHERFLGQKICFTFYAVCAALIGLRHYKRLLGSATAGLLFTAMFLCSSIAIDLFQESFPENLAEIRLITEDGFKFLGSFSWLYFIFHCNRNTGYHQR